MNEAAAKLQRLERAVMWRRRWLALQDHLALGLLGVGLIAAALVVLARLQLARLHWSLELVIFVIVAGALGWSWHRRRATDKEAAFLIDQTFTLEDRVTTAHEILARGGPQREVEQALVADAAARLDDKRAATVVPYRLRAWHAVAIAGVAAFAVAVAIPTKQLPGGEAVVAAQADIQNAGAQMEEVGEAIAKLAPAESETAKLAKEQAALGRSFRMSPESRAEALRQLSALEERIRKRHSELAATHADDIVSAAEKRMRNAIAPARKEKNDQTEANETAQAADDAALRDENQEASASGADKQTPARKQRSTRAKEPTPSAAVAQADDASRKVKGEHRPPNANAAEPQTTAANQQPKAESNPSGNQPTAAKGNPQPPQNQPQKPVSGQPPANATADSKNPNASPQGGNPPPAAQQKPPKADGQPATDPNAQGDQAKPEATNEASNDANNQASNPLASLAAEQAGKMLPQLSQELLKKAAELRNGKMSPEDIERLRQSAEGLARDLSKIAQSKEMQQMAEQLAKQITPEQVEQFARALGNQEQLKRELQASVRLMMENQQAKSMVAGMAQDLAKWGEQFDRGDRRNRQPNDGQPDQSQGNNQGNNRGARAVRDAKDEQAGREIMRAAGGLTEKSGGPRQPTGQGRDTRLSGNPQRGTGGEFLYLKSPAGRGASRAPYTSAYPQYRREAERSVERSQVPQRLRSVVKSYFDAINPDAAKKQ
ncbi:MAG TPA: hypothetical protein VKA60_13980 [Blastocatellia bacterium]|nr:hypothetical protein [Blastocatellia bacterium]